MKHTVKRTLCSPRSEEQGKNWTDSRGKQLTCTARSPGNEEKVREIKEAGWGEVGQFRVGKNFWTSTGANLRKTRAFLLGVRGGGDLLRCLERKSVWPRYHGSKISGGVCSFSSPEPLGLICNGLWGREWSLLRFSQTRAASFPVVLGDFGCDVPCQNTWTLKFKNERWNTETQKTDRNLACVQTPPPPLRKNRRRGPFSNFSWGEGGLYTG